MKLTAIDFETANASPASVCSVGISVCNDGVIEEQYYSLIRPEPNVSQFYYRNIRIHGIRPQDVADAPDFRRVFAEMKPFFEDAIICAHNASFDMGCLRAACQNCGVPLPRFRYFDTVALSRLMCPQLPNHRLNDMCSYLGIDLDHHNAASDAEGCLLIAVAAMNHTGLFEPGEMLERYGVRLKSL